MLRNTRREFLGTLGQGALALGFGSTLTRGLEAGVPLLEGREDLDFGGLEPLAALIQETPPEKLQEILVRKLNQGLELRELMAAASLANARTFGGHDYEGYHVAMAITPAFDMAQRLPQRTAALPVLKVIWRNAARIQGYGGRDAEELAAIEAAEQGGALAIQRAIWDRDLGRAERALAASCRAGAGQAFDDLQPLIQEDFEVHRIVLAWRAFDSIRLTGEENARTMLRQALHFCDDFEARRVRDGGPEPPLRKLVPALIDDAGLAERDPGTQRASDEQIQEWAAVFLHDAREPAARCATGALKEGYDPADIGQALSLAANELLLHDPGRESSGSYGRQRGSVHGASVGVHASDSARAWRNVARVVSPRNAAGSLIAGAYHTAGQFDHVGHERFPYEEHRTECAQLALAEQLGLARKAIEAGDQALACAAIESYGAGGGSAQAVIMMLLDFAVSSDGALHAEKYFATAAEDFSEARPAFRWNHLVGLARVSASESKRAAPGLAQARELLGV